MIDAITLIKLTVENYSNIGFGPGHIVLDGYPASPFGGPRFGVVNISQQRLTDRHEIGNGGTQ